MDNGRLKIENYKGVAYCEPYLDTEYGEDDLQSILDELNRSFVQPVDMILKKGASYSLSAKAQARLELGVSEIRNFVYLVDNRQKYAVAEYSASTYMKSYNTRIAQSLEEAFDMLKAMKKES